jgi:hypothetical protein
MADAPRLIGLKGTPIIHELIAASGQTITPGMICEKVPAADTCRVSATAALNALPFVALEKADIGGAPSVTYVAGELVRLGVFPPGSVVHLKLADGTAAIAKSDWLEQAADGTVRKAATDASTDDTQRNAMIAIADEAVDNATSGFVSHIRAIMV